MKDYHDLIVMTREKDFIDIEKLAITLKATFNQHKTQLGLINFEKEDMSGLKKFWSNHLRGLGKYRNILGLPDKIEDVIIELNNWMKANKIY